MHETHAHNKELVDNCFGQLQSMDIVPKSKMWKFYRNVSAAWVLLDSEFVECRRREKLTLKYTELQQKLHECITVFEQWSLMATLMY